MILAIIQDTYSTKFGQARGLLQFNGHRFLEEILLRLHRTKRVDAIAFITSTDACDDQAAAFAATILGRNVFRGDRRNVLSRSLLALKSFDAEHIVRINGCMPLIDPQYVDHMIALHKKKDADLTTCECQGAIIRGLGCEIVRAATLREISQGPLTPFLREFYTHYLKQNSDKYKVVKAHSSLSRPAYSLFVANRQDYVLVKEVGRLLKDQEANERAIVKLLDDNSHLVEINSKPDKPPEVGVNKLTLFPRKLEAVTSIGQGSIPLDTSYPISVELSLTDTCNLKCIWCSDRKLRMREHATMSKETVYALVKDLHAHGTRGIVLEGGGEPTVHPDFCEIVDHIHAQGLGIGLITNGVISLPQETLEKFEWVRVSLDACNAQEFKALKKYDAFDQVIDNIAQMARNCPVVGVGYVLTRYNYAFLEDLVFLLQKANMSYLQVRPVVDHPELTFHGDISHLRYLSYDQYPIMLAALQENACRGNSGLPCVAHSVTTVVSSSGNVFLCGRLNIYDWFKPIGNINTQPFNTIWNGKERAEQSAQVMDGTFCKAHCPQCRITKFNKHIEKMLQIKSKNFI